ncbi:MAG: hypothetical protein ACREMK_10415 [Gemmatimonadota bacterium]
MNPVPRNTVASLSCVLALMVVACSENLPTQVESPDFEEPLPAAPALSLAPLAFIEDALVMESLGRLQDEGVAVSSSWDALRAQLAHGDRAEARATIRATRAALAEVENVTTGSEDPVTLQVLLLALSDAEDAVAAEADR